MFYINEEYLEEGDAKIPATDLGVVRGFGVFDYLRTYQGRPFHLEDHLKRLEYSAAQLGITLPKSLQEIKNIILTVLKKSQYPEANIRTVITGGASSDLLHPEARPSLMVLCYQQNPVPLQIYEGIKTITTTLSRCLPTCKTTEYIPAIVALRAGSHKNAQDALYLNAKQEILEATTSNFFVFKKDTLITPFSGVYLGITRDVILRLSKPHFRIEERAIPYSEISEFDEAFLSSSSKEITPVIQIDEMKIGNGKVGKNTRRLMDLFTDYTLQGNWPSLGS